MNNIPTSTVEDKPVRPDSKFSSFFKFPFLCLSTTDLFLATGLFNKSWPLTFVLRDTIETRMMVDDVWDSGLETCLTVAVAGAVSPDTPSQPLATGHCCDCHSWPSWGRIWISVESEAFTGSICKKLNSRSQLIRLKCYVIRVLSFLFQDAQIPKEKLPLQCCVLVQGYKIMT